MPTATIAELALAAIQLAELLATRAQQNGEMTEAQRADLLNHAMSFFMSIAKAPPPPTPGA